MTISEERLKLDLATGHFGPYGGRFVPEALINALDELDINRVGFDTLDFLAGLAALPWRPLAHDVLPRSYPRLGVGVYTVPPHLGRPATWCQCPRARGHHTCNFFPY